ncbi:hypothetical protein [Nostocoides vanveenii]|uniref:UDP-N-acetylmuramyl pentapeptide phosphotransferase/UDP-N-acetylglucosamine-1-phosphate transferase n=1 Tax=Nostocoides vanveenii TaxID=330835 RepID=A0ABN2KKX7_9MICO
MTGPTLSSAAATITAAAAARWGGRALRAHPPGGAGRWTRTNHAGRPISLLEGPGYVAGAVLGALAGGLAARRAGARGLGGPREPRAWPQGASARPATGATVLAAVGAGAFGLLDDLAGDASSKGLRGHLGALREGRVTTGAVKIAGLAAAGAATAYLLDRPGARGTPALRTLPATLIGGAVIAGSANLANLLDLRPGRALKVAIIAAAPFAILADRTAGAALGAALGSLPDDLAGATMLGDTGANAAGSLVGAAVVARTGPVGRALVLGTLAGLTLASERVSFTTVIESTPVLRELDAWGRR